MKEGKIHKFLKVENNICQTKKLEVKFIKN